MKRSTGKKTAAALMGASVLLAGGANAASIQDTAQMETNNSLVVSLREETHYRKVSNVEGTFDFNQDELTPSDELFSLFGTVLTGVCAKPAFALKNGESVHYINVGGNIRKAYSVNLNDMRDKEESRVTLCSCATGSATGNVRITGVKLSDVLELADMDDGVNTLTVIGSDGYGVPIPLHYALEKKAMIVYKVNGQPIPSGTQFWVPETVAKYFTRDVIDIELTSETEIPNVQQRNDQLRAEVAIMNYANGCSFYSGEAISFEGYADDCADAIAAIEFSLDGGETWKAFNTEGATADRWVYWRFNCAPLTRGNYQLSVRAKTASGAASPLSANLSFVVEDVAL